MVLDDIPVKRPRIRRSRRNQARAACLTYAMALLSAGIILLGTGCNQAPCDGEHKQLTVEKNFAHFSMEYPCNWKRGVIETFQEPNGIRLSMFIWAPTVEIGESRVPSATWGLTIFWPSEEIPDAKAAQEDTLSFRGSFESFELIERSTVEIAGIAAEQAVFYDIIATDGVRVTEPIPNKVRILDFEYGGLIWSIYSSYPLAAADEGAVHIDRMLETFQILD